MKSIYYTLIFFTISLLVCITSCRKPKSRTIPENYDVIWTKMSQNSGESMPLGGGDVGLNVWVENGDLLFYIGQSGTFDENNQMLKHGRVRIKLDPSPFKDIIEFKQKLNLWNGNITIDAKNKDNSVHFNLWVDVYRPVIHIETDSWDPVDITAQYETWRCNDHIIPQKERSACFSYSGYEGEIVKYRDSIAFGEDDVCWFHRNRDDKLLIDFAIEQQGLDRMRNQINNTQLGQTFGGMMYGSDMKPESIISDKYAKIPYTAYGLTTQKKTTKNQISIVLNTGQYESASLWKEALMKERYDAERDTDAKEKTRVWWNEYWDRSYILIQPDSIKAPLNLPDSLTTDSAIWEVGRNYQLFRYMLGCNAYGKYPTKFNGGLLTTDPYLVSVSLDSIDPDYRAWGGGSFTAQNQRLVYWPMLKSGDFDMMPSQLDMYNNTLSAAEARVRMYWGHGGACYTEHLETFGLPAASTWGFDSGVRTRNPQTELGVLENRYVRYHYLNQLEFSYMILDYYRFSEIDINKYLPFIKSSVRFFDEHYQYRHRKQTGNPLDEDGKLVFYPSTATEMYKEARNPVDVIAALNAVVSRLLELPNNYVSQNEKKYYVSLLNRIPAISFEEKEGHKVIKPAESWEYVANSEIPELYPLYPYNIYGLTKLDLNIAMNTWNYGESNRFRSVIQSWSQVPIFAARLGLETEASQLIVKKMGDSGRRFSAFWGPGFDWVPDHNHGGSGMIALQEMLMQTDNYRILLFPAWNKGWDVKFKLHAPYNTIIEAELKDGKIIRLDVKPQVRKKDIEIMIH